jgi:hypothetical protein
MNRYCSCTPGPRSAEASDQDCRDGGWIGSPDEGIRRAVTDAEEARSGYSHSDNQESQSNAGQLAQSRQAQVPIKSAKEEPPGSRLGRSILAEILI